MKKALTMIIMVAIFFGCCGLALISIHSCEWKSKWSGNATHHWKECVTSSCIEIDSKAEHEWGIGSESAFGVTEYACSVCGWIKRDERVTEVSDDKWVDAFNFGANYRVNISGIDTDGAAVSGRFIRDGNKISIEGLYSSDTPIYASIEGEKLYDYSIDEASGVWKREENTHITAEEYILYFEDQIFPLFLRDRSYYTYNTESRLYTADEIVLDGITFKNVSLGFLDGRVAMYKMEMVADLGNATVDLTVTYGNAAVTLPEVSEP